MSNILNNTIFFLNNFFTNFFLNKRSNFDKNTNIYIGLSLNRHVYNFHSSRVIFLRNLKYSIWSKKSFSIFNKTHKNAGTEQWANANPVLFGFWLRPLTTWGGESSGRPNVYKTILDNRTMSIVGTADGLKVSKYFFLMNIWISKSFRQSRYRANWT